MILTILCMLTSIDYRIACKQHKKVHHFDEQGSFTQFWKVLWQLYSSHYVIVWIQPVASYLIHWTRKVLLNPLNSFDNFMQVDFCGLWNCVNRAQIGSFASMSKTVFHSVLKVFATTLCMMTSAVYTIVWMQLKARESVTCQSLHSILKIFLTKSSIELRRCTNEK